MAKNKKQKADLLAKYKDLLKDSKGFIAVNTNKLDNVTIVSVKKELAQANSKFVVIKNTIFKLALQDLNVDPELLSFDGATAIVTYTEDPTVPAKVVKKVLDEQEILEPKFGYVEGQYLDKEAVNRLATIPSREELLAQLVGSLISPVRGFMTVATGNIRGLTQILSQINK